MKRLQRVAIPLINLSSHGGVRVIVELANFISKRGYDATIVIPRGKNSTHFKLSAEVSIEEVGPYVKWKIPAYALYLATLPFFLRKYDLILANFFPTYFPSILASLLYRSKIIYFVQGIEMTYSGCRGLFLNLLCRLTYFYKKIIIAANPSIEEKIKEMNGIGSPKGVNIGLSDVFFEQTLPNKAAKRAFDVIYFLRHESWKRSDLFYELHSELARLIPSLRILCISQDEKLLEYAASRGLDTCKPADDLELISCIDNSKLMLLTSSYEGFGLPPLECMSRGVPAVVFECGGPSVYIINNVNSVIVSDKTQAIQSLTFLLQDSAARNEMANAAMLTAARFKNSSAFNKLISLF